MKKLINKPEDVVFEMAAELAAADGIEVVSVVTNDDVAVQDSLSTAGRRGVGVTVLLEKIVGGLAETGAPLAAVASLAQLVNAQGLSMGMALTSCTLPAAAQPTIVVRTLDAGADKPFPALEALLGSWKEANPALGLRRARIHLLYEDLLRQQLRALLRAAREAAIHLQIMFPMIATLEEVRRLKAVLHDTQRQVLAEGQHLPTNVQLGVMIETPSAVWMAESLAREVDFFSIGANDLFQYILAADRTNSRVTGLFGELEPALWRAIAHVVTAAQAHNCLVAVCGEIAADPRYAPLLAGLGVRELSVSPPALSRIKEALHQRTLVEWRTRALAMLQAETAAELAQIVNT